jgi:hypothetical protein
MSAPKDSSGATNHSERSLDERLHKLEEKANVASGFVRGLLFLGSLAVSTGAVVFILNLFHPDIPVGTILAWDALDRSSSSPRAVPNGWRICDGTEGTPDLTERFLMGVTDRRNSGKIGGSNIPQLGGAHNHGGKTGEPGNATTFRARVDQGGGSDHDFYPALQEGWNGSEKPITNHIHGIGEEPAHQHGADSRPSYYSVVFIMKTK